MSFLKKPLALANGSEVLTIVGPEAMFHGSMTVRGSIRVEGRMEGDITDAEEIVVGKGGQVRGNVCAERAEIGGEVVGDIVCSAALEIKSQGRVLGNVRTPRLLIEDGAVFEGTCSMSEQASPQPAAT